MALCALWAVASLLLSLPLALLIWKVLSLLVWEPLRMQKCLRDQGIGGPPYRIFVGNLREIIAMTKASRASPLPHITHDIMPRVLPDFSTWSEQYGKPFLYWQGWKSRLAVVDPELCKELFTNKFGHYVKPAIPKQMNDLLVNGLVLLEGEKWAQHRKIVNPAFFLDKLKGMVPIIVTLTNGMLEKWKRESENPACKEIDAFKEFHGLAADFITHTAFGSSYAEGKQVFLLQYEQQALLLKLSFSALIPGIRFLPTAVNRYRWKLRKQIEATLLKIVKKRLSLPSDDYGSDLLGLMLSARKEEDPTMTLQDIIDECKTFFFAGHETTTSLITWTVMLLANHPEWQESARKEVLSLFGTSCPNADLLNHLKIIGMILQESLRLYPPVTGTLRETTRDGKLGNIFIPKGTGFFVGVLPLHVDRELWGDDALEFNPLRFANGVLKACKHPSAFVPFGSGPRTCAHGNSNYATRTWFADPAGASGCIAELLQMFSRLG
ncbi:hypothetical protein GOP47_0002887 [Adiantum capillus-veneris]|uniref:Cytochrome P450 n=1 Tax=Adiantum capillus-veneris TaxID=13818 RepID=A0A9D4VB65_ADICA|nr:hypothetical protein GOP47_0002887 [Adiantum capillus-veneris]